MIGEDKDFNSLKEELNKRAFDISDRLKALSIRDESEIENQLWPYLHEINILLIDTEQVTTRELSFYEVMMNLKRIIIITIDSRVLITYFTEILSYEAFSQLRSYNDDIMMSVQNRGEILLRDLGTLRCVNTTEDMLLVLSPFITRIRSFIDAINTVLPVPVRRKFILEALIATIKKQLGVFHVSVFFLAKEDVMKSLLECDDEL